MTLQKRLYLIFASMFCLMIAQASVGAQGSMIEGDESNDSLDKVVIERSFSEIEISSLKGSYPDGTVVLPPTPWTIGTNYGMSQDNAQAVRASYKNIAGDAPYLKGLWTHDNALGGGAYGDKKIYFTDSKYLNGNFAVELKYIPYKIERFPNGNYYGAMPNYGTGVIQVNVGSAASWDFSFENNSVYPVGIKANILGTAYTCSSAQGAGMNPTIGATVEELPDDFNGYHYVRLEFTEDEGATVLTRYGEDTPWKKIIGAENAMKSLKIDESNSQLIFNLHRGFVGVDSIKVLKSSAEYPDYIADSLEINKSSNGEYKVSVNLTNIGTEIPAVVRTEIYETEGLNQTLVDEIEDEYTGTVGQEYIYEKNISVPQDGKDYILKTQIVYRNNIIKSIEYGSISVLSENVTSNGKIELGGAVSIIEDSSVTFKNKETQAETEGEYTIDENGAFLIPKTRLDEGVEYEINVSAGNDINLKTIDFDGNNVVKVLYDVYAKLVNNENSVNYKLKNRLGQTMEAQIVVIKYNGLKMSSLEFETISLAENEEKQGQKTIVLESGQTAKVFILNNLTDYVLISDAITVE